jgi:hypothetical protein
LAAEKQKVDQISNKFERLLGLAHSAGAELLKTEPVLSSAKSACEGATSQVYESASSLYSKVASPTEEDSQTISASASSPTNIQESASSVLARASDAVGSAYESGHEAVDAAVGDAPQRIFSVAAAGDAEPTDATSEDSSVDDCLDGTTKVGDLPSQHAEADDDVESHSSPEDSVETTSLYGAATSSITHTHAAAPSEPPVSEGTVTDAAAYTSPVSDEPVPSTHASKNLSDDGEEEIPSATPEVISQHDEPVSSVSESASPTPTARDEL